jgi:CheY-like chemotaxis protein
MTATSDEPSQLPSSVNGDPKGQHGQDGFSMTLGTGTLADLRDLRVLFVEDEDDARELAAVALREGGADVAEARSLGEAISLMHSFRPDVLVSDLGLGGDDGVELIRRVRALPRKFGGAVPAIALTGRTRIEDCCAALGAGFQVHVAKPIDVWFLTHAVANVAGLEINLSR